MNGAATIDSAVAGEHRLAMQGIFETILELHPDHLTIPELILKVANHPKDRRECEALELAIGDLSRSGVIRKIGEVLVPTHAALQTVTVLDQR